MSFVTLNIFPNLHTHFSLIQSLSYCRNIYAFSFYPHSPNMNDVQNIVYLYFLHHAPFRETLHGSIYANNKWRNNSVTALNIPRIGVAYAPKPNEKKRSFAAMIFAPRPVIQCPNNSRCISTLKRISIVKCFISIRGLYPRLIQYWYSSRSVNKYGSILLHFRRFVVRFWVVRRVVNIREQSVVLYFSAFNPGAGSPSAPNNSNCAFLPLKRNA